MADPPGDDSPQREVSLIMWSDTSSSGSEHDSIGAGDYSYQSDYDSDDNDKPVDTFSYIRPPMNCSAADPDGDRGSMIRLPPVIHYKSKPPPETLQSVPEPSIISDDSEEEDAEAEAAAKKSAFDIKLTAFDAKGKSKIINRRKCTTSKVVSHMSTDRQKIMIFAVLGKSHNYVHSEGTSSYEQ